MKNIDVGSSETPALVLTLMSTTGAKADGISFNTCTAQLTNGTNFISGQSVIFNIVNGSGNFSNGNTLSVVSTDSLGQASVAVVSTEPGTVIVQATLANNTTITNQTSFSFSAEAEGGAEKITLFIGVDNSPADGKHANEVEVGTRSVENTIVPSTRVALSLDNNASFIDGSTKTSVVTDSAGNATVPFFNSSVGDVQIRAYLLDNVSIYNIATSTFVKSQPEATPSVTLSIVDDDALANGASLNRVQALVRDVNTGLPLAGASIRFTASGSAKFSDSGIPSFITVTDVDGTAGAGIYDDNEGEVTVTVTLTEYPSVNDSINISFMSDYSDLKISRVWNTNKRFGVNEPSTAWPSARFIIDAAGGSGQYSWGADKSEGNVLGVSLMPTTNKSSVMVEFTSDVDYGEYTITLIDDVTKESIDYIFKISTIFETYGHSATILGLHLSGVFDSLTSPEDLVNLYREWGDMSKYSGWTQNADWYWTHDFDFIDILGTVINVRTGQRKVIVDLFYNAGTATIKN